METKGTALPKTLLEGGSKCTTFAQGSMPPKGEVIAGKLAFSMAEEFGGQEVIIEGDSLSLVNQVSNEESRANWIIEGEVETIRLLLQKHPTCKLQWTPREGNDMAHRVKWGLYSVMTSDIVLDSFPLILFPVMTLLFLAEPLRNEISCYSGEKRRLNWERLNHRDWWWILA